VLQTDGNGSSASGSLSSESMTETDLGTSVDDLINLQSSREALASGQPTGVPRAVKELMAESSAPLASPESIRSFSPNPNPSQDNAAGNIIDEIVETVKDNDEKVDKLAKLAAQIDDFDPAEMFERSEVRVTEPEVRYTDDVDINDDKLIDKLIGEAEVGAGVGKETGKREVAPTDNVDVDNDDGVDSNGSGSKGEQNDLAERSNGTMSASTESDGFEDGNQENGEEENKSAGKDEAETSTASKETDKVEKTGGQKTESAGTAKTGKSKKKEDKSIGK